MSSPTRSGGSVLVRLGDELPHLLGRQLDHPDFFFYFIFFFSERRFCYAVIAYLELELAAVLCLSLPSAGIAGVYKHAWELRSAGFRNTRAAISWLSAILVP